MSGKINRHYGLVVGDKVVLRFHPIYKNEVFEIVFCYSSDNNCVRVRSKQDDLNVEFDWTAEWCIKTVEEKNIYGEWQKDETDGAIISVAGDNSEHSIVAKSVPEKFIPLITAAPELLCLLKEAVVKSHEVDPRWLAVIQKVEGGSRI